MKRASQFDFQNDTRFCFLCHLPPAAGVGMLAYHSGRAALFNAVTSGLLSAATEKEAALNAWIADEVLHITTFAASPKIRDGVQAFLSARQDSTGPPKGS